MSDLAGAFRSRLKETIAEMGLDNAVQASGRSAKTLARYIDGSTEPPFVIIAEVAKAAHVSITWLATGAGARDSQTEISQLSEGTQPERKRGDMLHVDPASLDGERLAHLPLLEVQASAGRGLISQGEAVVGFVPFQESYLRSINVNPRFAHMLQISGDSMMPTLAHQDWVVVDTSIDRVVDEAIYAVVYGDRVLAKRIRMLLDGGLVLSSDNKAAGYTDEHVPPADLADLRIVGRICTRTTTL